uniref:Uncharacterized protein n=1 Tax=Salix viminalis TaxID=40686 RepID=A0A6N2KT64_SALVM
MASNSMTLWWRELALQKQVDQKNHKARASWLNHPAISLRFGAVVSTRKQMPLLLIDSWLCRNISVFCKTVGYCKTYMGFSPYITEWTSSLDLVYPPRIGFHTDFLCPDFQACC